MWQFWHHALCMTKTFGQNWGWHKIARPGTCRKLKDKEDRTFTASILQSDWWQQFCWPCDLEDKAGLAPSALDQVLEMCIVVLPTDIMHYMSCALSDVQIWEALKRLEGDCHLLSFGPKILINLSASALIWRWHARPFWLDWQSTHGRYLYYSQGL